MRNQTFAISSEQGSACLQAEQEGELKQEENKKKKQMAKQNKKGTRAQPKSLKRKFEQVLEEESSHESLMPCRTAQITGQIVVMTLLHYSKTCTKTKSMK